MVFLVALAVAAVGIIVVVTSAGGGVKSRPGSPAVYSRIEGLTSCSELQAEFDTAAANYDSRDLKTCRTDSLRPTGPTWRLRTSGCASSAVKAGG